MAPAASGWWLRASRIGEQALPAITRAFPFIVHGREADENRSSDGFTRFDGLAPNAGPDLDPTRTDRVVSATLLHNAAGCPFRYFLEHGLGIDPIEEPESDDDVWLDALRRGSELHDFYAGLLRRAREAGRRVSSRADLMWFLALGRQRLEELKREIPPPSDEVWSAESEEFLDDLRTFVESEEETENIEPVAFEVGFGRPERGDAEALARPEPVVITLGKGRRLQLAGRIDRIDQTGRSTYQVVDYKTGYFRRDEYAGTFRQGRLLQHALYGLAAEELLAPRDKNAKVTRGIYWHPTGRGHGRRASIDAPAKSAIADVLTRLADVIGQGLFIQAPAEGACRFCPFTAACGKEPWTAANRKAEANVDDTLAAWGALQEVE